MVLSGKLPNNFFVYKIPQLSYATQIEIGYTDEDKVNIFANHLADTF